MDKAYFFVLFVCQNCLKAAAGLWLVGGGLALRAMLVPACIALTLLFSVTLQRQIVHAFTPTSRPSLHGAMYRVWQKSDIPHLNSQRNTKQTQNAIALSCRLVACCKTPRPHKEKNCSELTQPQKRKKEVRL
jgi:hypothetical protein